MVMVWSATLVSTDLTPLTSLNVFTTRFSQFWQCICGLVVNTTVRMSLAVIMVAVINSTINIKYFFIFTWFNRFVWQNYMICSKPSKNLMIFRQSRAGTRPAPTTSGESVPQFSIFNVSPLCPHACRFLSSVPFLLHRVRQAQM